MSENNIKINYDFPKFPPSSIQASELERLQKIDNNIQKKISKLKDYIFEAESLHNTNIITKEWLEETINNYEQRIRELEKLTR
jgi:hypothetical protein